MDTRGEEIASYNSAVKAWTTPVQGGLSPYSAMQGTTAVVTSDTSLALSMSSNSAVNIPGVESGSGIDTYTQYASLAGMATSSSPFDPMSWSNDRRAPLVSFSVNNSAPLDMYDVPLMKYTEDQFGNCPSGSSGANNARCVGGFFTCVGTSGSYSTCRRYWVLSQVCLLWDPLTSSYVPNSGCAASSVPDGATAPDGSRGDGFRRFAYKSYAFPPSGLSDVRLALRAKQDLWVVAMQVTFGKGRFGMSIQDKITFGSGLLGAGLAIMALPPLILFVLMRYCGHRRLSKRLAMPQQQQQGAVPVLAMDAGAGGYAAYGQPQAFGQPQMQQPPHYAIPYGVPAQQGGGLEMQQPQMQQGAAPVLAMGTGGGYAAYGQPQAFGQQPGFYGAPAQNYGQGYGQQQVGYPQQGGYDPAPQIGAYGVPVQNYGPGGSQQQPMPYVMDPQRQQAQQQFSFAPKQV